MTCEMRAVCAQTVMPTVSSRVEQRVVRQVVVGLAEGGLESAPTASVQATAACTREAGGEGQR